MSSNFEFKYTPYKESENAYGSLTLNDVYGRFSSEAGGRSSFFDMQQDKGSFAFDDRMDGPTKPSRSSNSIVQQVMNYGRPPAVSRSLATLDDERVLCERISNLPSVAMSRANGSVQAPQEDVEALKADNLELRERVRASTETIVTTRDENNALRAQIKESAATIEELNRRLRETKAATGAGQEDLQRLADELGNVKKLLTRAESDRAVEVGKVVQQAEELTRMRATITKQRAQLLEKNREIRDKADVIAEHEIEKKHLLDRIRRLSSLAPPAAAGGDEEGEQDPDAGYASSGSHEV
jgi:uncharacterized coiled-coil protein SlyX